MIAIPIFSKNISRYSKNRSKCLGVGLNAFLKYEEVEILEQFDFRPDGSDLRIDKQPLSYQEAFTCNLSILTKTGRDWGGSNNKLISFEDVEFAYRALQMGLEIRLLEQAIAYHNHSLDLAERCNQAKNYTITVPLLYRLHPNLCGQIAQVAQQGAY